MRKIIHVDMDAFFASVEQNNNKSLKGKPVVVGGDGLRSVVAAASYEVRKFGVHSAMPMMTAKRLCPNLVIVKPNFPEYRRISEQVREIFSRFSELVEPLSIDEAYLDVTNVGLHQGSATLIAKDILAEIKLATNLTASAGVSYNKFLAKYASNINKPAGIFVITPSDSMDIITKLPIKKFYGVGPATEKKLNDIGILTGEDLRRANIERLRQQIGKSADFYHKLSFGIDEREVKSERVRKSIANERTFPQDISNVSILLEVLYELLDKTMQSVNKRNLYAKTLTIKVKFSDFKIKTKSYTEKGYISDKKMAKFIGEKLLTQIDLTSKVRLLGISFSHLNEKSSSLPLQLRLFD